MTSGNKNMSCEDVLKHLFEFLDGELHHTVEGDIEHHLKRCRSCFSRADFERRLKQKLAETGETEAPASLRARVRGLITKF